jgi:hypothetical protein
MFTAQQQEYIKNQSERWLDHSFMEVVVERARNTTSSARRIIDYLDPQWIGAGDFVPANINNVYENETTRRY